MTENDLKSRFAALGLRQSDVARTLQARIGLDATKLNKILAGTRKLQIREKEALDRLLEERELELAGISRIPRAKNPERPAGSSVTAEAESPPALVSGFRPVMLPGKAAALQVQVVGGAPIEIALDCPQIAVLRRTLDLIEEYLTT